MLTPTTTAVFARDRANIEANVWFNAHQRRVFRLSNAERHAEYERHYDATVVALTKLTGRVLDSAIRRIAKLGGPGALSGTLEYRDLCDGLARVGLPRMNAIFDHDRKALVEQFGCERRAA